MVMKISQEDSVAKIKPLTRECFPPSSFEHTRGQVAHAAFVSGPTSSFLIGKLAQITAPPVTFDDAKVLNEVIKQLENFLLLFCAS